MKRVTAILLAVILLVISLSLPVFAEPTDAFTHVERQGGKVESVMSREMYRSTKVIKGSTLGLDEPFMGLSDIVLDDDGNIYLLLGYNIKITVLIV